MDVDLTLMRDLMEEMQVAIKYVQISASFEERLNSEKSDMMPDSERIRMREPGYVEQKLISSILKRLHALNPAELAKNLPEEDMVENWVTYWAKK